MSLSSSITSVLIIRHKEDVTQLVSSLVADGLKACVVQTSYNSEQQEYSQSIKCLLAHKKAWKKCVESKGVYLIVEADFVPVKGIGKLPMPCDKSQIGNSITHVYSSAQRLARIDQKGYAYGHSATTVAYIVNSDSAKKLMQFSTLLLKHDRHNYLPWDIILPRLATSMGMRIYFPFRSYGEHGGIENPEHKKKRNKAGINGVHRADSLMGELHFLPTYAKGNKYRYYFTRAVHKLRAFARVLSGRYVESRVLLNPDIQMGDKINMLKIGFSRLLP